MKLGGLVKCMEALIVKGVENVASIKSVVEARWTRKDASRRTEGEFTVIYASGKRVKYDSRKTLPMSVVRFILSDKVEAETRYIENDIGPLGTIKQTKYTRRKREND